jgi:transposase
MSRRSSRPALLLEPDVAAQLSAIAASRTAPARDVERASVMLQFARGVRVADISRSLSISRDCVDDTLSRAQEFGPLAALRDRPGRGRPRSLTPEARAWVIELACIKPKELGYAAELWSNASLAKHAREHGFEAGHGCLARLGSGTVSKILRANHVQPHRIEYYLERRDPEFDVKRAAVLAVYQEVELLRADGTGDVAVVSFDEKPGIQAVQNLAPDLPPVPGRHRAHARDHQYRRHGTVSLLAGIDLVTGIAHGIVRERHRSREFVEFLATLDEYYPPATHIRVVLDNHAAHGSQETRSYLATRPGRFEFIFTPKHGSWLNLVEAFFAKMAKTMLRGIRVQSKAELRERIEMWLLELNEDPVIFRWKHGLDALAMGASS